MESAIRRAGPGSGQVTGEGTGEVTGAEIRVRGLVQGVGFRPTVWRLACDCDLAGDVRNDSDGVLIRAWGTPAALAVFVRRLRAEAPPLARIDALERRALGGSAPAAPFRILASVTGRAHTGVAPDAASCAACVAETFDPSQRRYRYPFTNCTHCGPRLSIVRAIPYDRRHTSMAGFALCADCGAEYADPAERRFHAQPIACPACGPRVWLETNAGAAFAATIASDAIDGARRLLQDGHIVAVKGLGGFHLACDAGNARAVARLRSRKMRYHKAFALMARDVAMVERYCSVSAQERALLQSPMAPIVLCAARPDAPAGLAPAIAPGLATLGFMLPYTPLHHLLLDSLERPLVLSSGNLCDEPQCTDNDEARQRLSGIADYLLLHDRDIVNRVDDSVVRVIDGAPRLLRRARGYAPAPLPLPPGFERAPPVLAMGSALKNAFCLLADGQAILAPHQGDLEDGATQLAYRRQLDLLRGLFQHAPETIAIDLHPDYVSSRLGAEWAARDGLALEAVQHHHAHVASCMADNGLALDAAPLLGIALDGLGMGAEGELWGGEFLQADYRAFRRVARFKPVALIGATQALREPWRNTYAHLAAALGWGAVREQYATLELTRFLAAKPLATFDAMLAHGINCPAASSCGRLFDAVAAALGMCRDCASYEGQAAIELEALAAGAALDDRHDPYPFALAGAGAALREIDAAPMWRALLRDLAAGMPPARIAWRFHAGLAQAVAAMAEECGRPGTVALSGGVFQNRLFGELAAHALRARGFTVLGQRQVPANDGGLALGQAVIAAARALQPLQRRASCA